MSSPATDRAKAVAGRAAAALVENGMRVGLGTGSTTAYVIEALGDRIRQEGLQIIGIPTSFGTERRARASGIPLSTLDEVDRLDLALDGADEIDPALNLIKGGGGALTRERVVAGNADRLIIVADDSKLGIRLGVNRPVPVEFLPMACGPVSRTLRNLGGRPELRMAVHKDGPVVTDQGFWILDVWFDSIEDPASLANAIRTIPGVLDHGLFVGMTSLALIGDAAGDVRHLPPAP